MFLHHGTSPNTMINMRLAALAVENLLCWPVRQFDADIEGLAEQGGS